MTIQNRLQQWPDGCLVPPDHPIASHRALLAFVKMAIQDLLPLANMPQHKAVKAYGESAIEMIETHCIVYDLQDAAGNKNLDPQVQELLSHAAEVISRLLKAKAKIAEED